MLVLDKHNDTGLSDKGGQLFDERNLLKWSTFILAFTLHNILYYVDAISFELSAVLLTFFPPLCLLLIFINKELELYTH